MAPGGKFLTTRANHHARGARVLRDGIMRTRRGALRWRSRVGLIALGVLLGALAGEAMARLVGFEFRPHMRNRVYFAEPDSLLGWRNRPGLAGPYGGDEFVTWVTINPDGQRGPSHPRARVAGKRRIAVLGDSQTWGDGVADDETFVARLDGGANEMLSFASPGWGTDQQLLELDNEAARYAPDVVVLATFVGNDLADNANRGSFQYPKPYFTLEDGSRLVLHGVPVPFSRPLHALIEVYRGLMRNSALLNAVAEAVNNGRGGGEQGAAGSAQPVVELHNSMYLVSSTSEDTQRFALTSRLLIEVARHARAIGAQPVVLLIPELWQVEVYNHREQREALAAMGADFRRPQRIFRAALRREGVTVIDALPALAHAARHSEIGSASVYYPQWRHLNAGGHTVVARLLAARLGIRPMGRGDGSSR
jgi:hypothetical protein